ncbi:MAG: type II CAAX endopeptidase family protein [Chryseolinea sp.]
MHIFLNTERKLRSIWWVFIFFLVLAAFVVPLIILSQHYSFEISISLQVVVILMVSIVCQKLARKSLNDLLGVFNFVWFKELLIGMLIGSGLMILPAMILTVFGYVNWQTNVFSFSIIISGIGIFLAVAAAEELLFRGFIFQRLIHAFGKWPAQFIIAGLFLLTHLNNPGMSGVTKQFAVLNIFIASIMFGIAYLKTKNLAMPLGLHFMANFVQGTVLGFGVSGGKEVSVFKPIFTDTPIWLSGGDFGLEASILGLVFVTLFTVLFYFWKR